MAKATREDLLARVRKAMGAISCPVPAEKVIEGASLKNDLDLDSADLVEVILAIEEEFGISVKDEDVARARTVADLIAYLENSCPG